MDVRFIVTNIQGLSDQVLNDEIYCPRGQAENWIKEYKLYLSSDRTSCHQWQAIPNWLTNCCVSFAR